MNEQRPKHPSLAFYRGDARVQVTVPAANTRDEGPATTTAVVVVGIIKLHHTIFPPAPVDQLGEVADENYAVQVASEAGLPSLRLNWSPLLAVLFPCFLEGDPLRLPVTNTGEDNHSSNNYSSIIAPVDRGDDGDALSGDATPVISTQPLIATPDACLSAHITTADYDGLREPGMMDRIYYSFVSYLRFLGWKVHDEQRGKLDRHRGWRARYDVLEAAYTVAASSSGAPQEFIWSLPPVDPETSAPTGSAAHVVAKVRVAFPTLLSSSPVPSPPPVPLVGCYDFYTAALLRITTCFLDIGFLTLAVGLVEFLLEEIAAGRLLFLRPLVERALQPLIDGCGDIEPGHQKRLRRKLFKLTHSDSD